MRKKGISLIVLIITIIVVIILAAVVILTLSKNNPIESAKEASFKEDIRTFQDELALAVSKEYANAAGQRDEKITTSDFDEIKEYIPSFSEKYKDKFVIQNDELKYTIQLDEKQKEYSQDLNVKEKVLKLLPDEYQQVEYIESTGTQWIDIGVKSADDLALEIEYIPKSYYPEDAILGSRTNDFNCQIILSSYDNFSAGSYIRFGNGTWDKVNVGIGILQLNTKHSVNLLKNNVYLDGIRVAGTKNSDFSDNGKSMALFAFRNSTTGNIIAYSKCQIFKFMIKKSTQKIRNFIPCYSITSVTDVNGKSCPSRTKGMYDIIEGKFYTNQGTGEDFRAGPAVD